MTTENDPPASKKVYLTEFVKHHPWYFLEDVLIFSQIGWNIYGQPSK